MIGWRTFAAMPPSVSVTGLSTAAWTVLSRSLPKFLGLVNRTSISFSACFWRLSNCDWISCWRFCWSCACFSSSWSCAWAISVYRGVADVYAPDFEQAAERAAVQAEGRKDDPYLLGYFLGNELPWPGRESVAADALQ